MTLGVELGPVSLPVYDLPVAQPSVPLATYQARLAAAAAAAAAAGLDALLVYADREHFANLSYLTGYDPRFEESLLIMVPGRPPVLLVGNEGVAYAAVVPPEVEVVLHQSFSLVNQDRSVSPRLEVVLGKAGLGGDARRVGIAGWKWFSPAEADQLACFEFAATHGSESMRRLLFGVRPGLTELSAYTLYQPIGLPLPYHPVLLSGERAALGLASASGRVLRQGDPMVASLGYWGSNIARGGFLAAAVSGLPAVASDYVERLVAPYFACAATGTVYHTSNIEDGVALADASLRASLASGYPGLWERVGQRRAFMADVLGIRLKPEVLPLSNLAGYLPPLWLSPQLAMRRS